MSGFGGAVCKKTATAFVLTPSYVDRSMPLDPMCWMSSCLKKKRMLAMYVGLLTTPLDAMSPSSFGSVVTARAG